MGITSEVLISSQRVPDSATQAYMSTNRKSIVDMFTVTNTTDTAATLKVWVVPPSGSQEDANLIVPDISIDAGAVWLGDGMVGRRLDKGEAIYWQASDADTLTGRAEGRGVT